MEPLNTQTDLELLLLMKADNEPAFTEIYNRYWDTAYKAAYNVLNDDEACMDIVQDVFVWLWRNRLSLQVNALKSYLITAVRFKMLNFIRDGKFRVQVAKSFKTEECGESFTDISIELKELKAMIDQIIETLPEQARKIFHLSRSEHLSHKEIALKLGISEKTVKNQINLSLKKMRASLGRMSIWICFLF